MKAESSPSAWAVSSGGRSGDSMAASDQRRKFSRSASSMPRSSAITVSGNGAASSDTKSISPVVSTASSRSDAQARMESARSDSARGREAPVDEPAEVGVLGRVHMQDRGSGHGRGGHSERVVDQRTAARAEALRVAAEVADVLVAGHRPEARRALVHRVLRAQPGQHLVVVRAGEEGRVARIDVRPRPSSSPHRRRRRFRPLRRLRRSRALVLGHGASVLCSAMRTRDDSLAVDGRGNGVHVSSSPYPASPEHAPLSGLDEFLVHNAPYPVRVMWTPDAQAYERVWFTCQDKVGDLLVVIGLAFYPNLGTAEAFAIVNVRGSHTTVRAHRTLGTDRMDMALGPFSFEVVEPFRRWRLRLDGQHVQRATGRHRRLRHRPGPTRNGRSSASWAPASSWAVAP